MWDDLPAEKRELVLAYDQLVCSDCGNLRSECSDPTIDWHPRKSVCYASAATSWGWRKLHEHYPPDKKESDGAHRLDGVSLWVSSVEPASDDPDVDPIFR